jgi:AraC-like DNA-binding protein
VTAENDQINLQTVTSVPGPAVSPPIGNNGHEPPLAPPLLCHATRCPLDRSPGDPPPSPRLARILDLPQRAGDLKFRVRAAARSYGFSTRTLERNFESALASVPQQCLACLGLRRAAELLKAGKNVSETAGLVGYNEHSHFSRIFKQWDKCPPKLLESGQRHIVNHGVHGVVAGHKIVANYRLRPYISSYDKPLNHLSRGDPKGLL